MKPDAKSAKILAHTFFQQLKGGGYNSNQIIGVASELIDLVTLELRAAEKADPHQEPEQELRRIA